MAERALSYQIFVIKLLVKLQQKEHFTTVFVVKMINVEKIDQDFLCNVIR